MIVSPIVNAMQIQWGPAQLIDLIDTPSVNTVKMQ